MKIDRQILAIARTRGADVIYSDDRHVINMGAAIGLKVVGVSTLPLRPVKPLPPLLQQITDTDADDTSFQVIKPKRGE